MARSPTSTADSPTVQPCRCSACYNGSAHHWGFAIYLASKDGYEDSFLPSGRPFGTPQEALDCAAGLYLNNPAERQQPPTN